MLMPAIITALVAVIVGGAVVIWRGRGRLENQRLVITSHAANIAARGETIAAQSAELITLRLTLIEREKTAAAAIQRAADSEKLLEGLHDTIGKLSEELGEAQAANGRLKKYADDLDEYVDFIRGAFGLPPDVKRPTPDQVKKSVMATEIEADLGIRGMQDFYRLDALARRQGHGGVTIVPRTGPDSASDGADKH